MEARRETPLAPGDAAPDFSLPDQDGRRWTLSELRGRRVIIFFYPEDDTPGCTTEACDFRDNHDDLTRAGYIVLGVSPQDARSHRAFADKYRLNFPLLIDADLAVARAYHSLRAEAGSSHEVARSTFVIDERGSILEARYGVKARGHVADLRGTLAVV